MFKVLVLQYLFNLSDDQTGFQIRDRYSFCHFLGLSPEGKVPDAKTVPGYLSRSAIEPVVIA
ncbi:transposase [Candidatus Vondammii sp. HM_W22]|uniref:transposase n=1 Tax=Candidatus Vondammii sp. HM_W22 TaxID=2687299 RepID=UPI00403D5C8C